MLNRSGYARYDESTSRMLGKSAEMLLDTHTDGVEQFAQIVAALVRCHLADDHDEVIADAT